jgi:hypothetical protein
MAKAPIEIRSLARAHTAGAIKTLAGIMNETKSPAAARVSAAQALLDRGWGKAPQPLDGDGEGGAINLVTRVELVALTPNADSKD